MIAASCDNGPFPDKNEEDGSTLIVYDQNGTTGLPKISDATDQPIRLKSSDVQEKLRTKKANPAGSTTLVPVYKIGTVSTTPPTTYGAAAYSADDLIVAQKYAGLPILVTIVY